MKMRLNLLRILSNKSIKIDRTLATDSASLKRTPFPDLNAASLESFWSSVLSNEEEKQLELGRPWQRLEFIPKNDHTKFMVTTKGNFMHKNYDLKSRELDKAVLDDLEKENVLIQLNNPFEPCTQPKGINPNEWKNAFLNGRIWLLGTHEQDRKCQKDLEKLVKAIGPDIVMLELCAERSEEYNRTTMTMANRGPGHKSYPEVWEEYRKEYERRNEGRKISELSTWGQLKEDWKCMKEYADARKMEGMGMYRVNVKSKEFNRTMETVDELAKGCAGFVMGDLDGKIVERATKVLEAADERGAEGKELKRLMRKMGMQLWERSGMDFEEMERMEARMEQLAAMLGFQTYYEQIYGNRQRHMAKVLCTMLQRCTIEKFFVSQKIGVPFQPVNAMAIIGRAHLRGIHRLWMTPEKIYEN